MATLAYALDLPVLDRERRVRSVEDDGFDVGLSFEGMGKNVFHVGAVGKGQ